MGFSFSYGQQLQFFAVTVNLSINPFTIDIRDGPKYVKAWEEWFTKKVTTSVKLSYSLASRQIFFGHSNDFH